MKSALFLIARLKAKRISRNRHDRVFLVLVLQPVEPPVQAAFCEQLVVRAALAQLALVHYQYCVGALNGGQPRAR